jgi:hypothetical protein
MEPPLMLCIPGPWTDRSEFVVKVAQETDAEFLFAGMILAQPSRKRHVILEFCDPYPQMRSAFEIAGQGKLPANLLTSIEGHRSVVYLHFEVPFIQEREKMIDFSDVIRRVEDPFDWYCSLVTLIADDLLYYSCGMHNFGLPDVEVPRSVDISEAADLMNQFNLWRIVEEPEIASGHTFSVTADSRHFRLLHVQDTRHEEQELFRNTHGLWRLEIAT